jgi:hypothetical protein
MAGLFILVVLLLSCESRDKYVGSYKAENLKSVTQTEIVLDLKENGDGLWKVTVHYAKATSVEIPFTWYITHGDLRINTKAGGVIVGKINADTIRMTLPGSKALMFRKVQ